MSLVYMRFKPYKHPLWMGAFLLVFLASGCNQKPTQNADSKQVLPSGDPVGSQAPEASKKGAKDEFGAVVLAGSKSPTLIYGASPAYMEVAKEQEAWNVKFVEDASLVSPGMVDQSFPLNTKEGVQFTDDKQATSFGLYFAELPLKTRINVCGTSSCKQMDVTDMKMMVVRTTPEQFDDLYAKAKIYDPREIPEKIWNMYFLDKNLKTFQSENAVHMTVDEGETPTTNFDWNGVLDRTGKTGLTEEADKLQLKWIQLEKPVLVGKYKADDGQEYRVIGITTFKLSEAK